MEVRAVGGNACDYYLVLGVFVRGAARDVVLTDILLTPRLISTCDHKTIGWLSV